MKKIIFLSILFILAPLLTVRAMSVTVIDGRFIDRYVGNIILEDNVFNEKIWYLEPSSKERYLLNDTEKLNNLLTKFATKTTALTLKKIPTTNNQKSIDYNIAKKYSGQFLFDPSKKDEIWYINPLDLLRYKISADDNGLKILNDLAITLSLDKIDAITINKDSSIQEQENAINFQQYNELRDILETNYYKPEKINNQKLFYGSLIGLTESLDDPYTQFFTPTKKTQFDNSIEGSVEGIGAVVDIKNNILTIITPLLESPAFKAGLEPNDQVLEVDGTSIRNFSLDKSISLIKGPKDTIVNLKIYRPLEDKTFEVKITRQKIIIPNVEAKKLENNIVYFSITSFEPNMLSEFNKLRQQNIDTNTRGIIIDLRNNPGGYTDVALSLIDVWLGPDALVLQEKFRSHTEKYYTLTSEDLNIPTIVLINGSTASAAEIFSSALKENNQARLVGETSYGKGTGQMVQTFADGSAVKYTYFEWLTGLGESVENRGLRPDIEIKNDPQTKIDEPLIKALQLLR
jgi:carboxyl-terminal processing protease